MTILTVGTGKGFGTIAAAVAASASGDSVAVDAGTYANDFLTIGHDLALYAVGGPVIMVATVEPPNGKAIIAAGSAGTTVSITGFDVSGSAVSDMNGAAVRYQGGTLLLDGVNFHNNQNGILANADPDGHITIQNSIFDSNGAGDGYSHNIYIGDVASLVVKNSVITSPSIGHGIKSRAQSTTILDNVIADNATGTGSYNIDLPNGGAGEIRGNVIQKGAGADNPIGIAFGEEGGLHAGSSLNVAGNTIFNQKGGGTIAIRNGTGVTATVTDNSLFGWATEVVGPASVGGNTTLGALPVVLGLEPGTAANGHVASSPIVRYTDTVTGESSTAVLDAMPIGAPDYLDGQFIWSGPDSVAMSASVPNVFLTGGAADDALLVTSGQNVLDGGTGSNFLVGGSGDDTFFTDATGGQVVWNTLVNFGAGDASTLWGFDAAVSTYSWDARTAGAEGYTGATLRASLSGAAGVEASITFAGVGVEQAAGFTLQTGEAGGRSYLYITTA